MTKQEIMRLANKLMDELYWCEDDKLVDDICERMRGYITYTAEEIDNCKEEDV